MSPDRVAVVEAALDELLDGLSPRDELLDAQDPVTSATSLSAGAAINLFEDQIRSRVLDVVGRELKARGQGYYTISSAGHEDNATVGALTRPTDPCFLHYRSGGLYLARRRQLGDGDPLWDVLLSFCAAEDDPATGGRHKAWGSVRGWLPPQTSTIASHVPKAVGAAFAIGRSVQTGVQLPIPNDSIVVCSFGDASANHATALAGISSARWAQRRGAPTPLLLVCEDNGIGISVETPTGWIAQTFQNMPGLRYVRAEGEIDQVWTSVEEAVNLCRTLRAPVFLHLDVVRLWGHAGSDVEAAYRTAEEVTRSEERDPVRRTARRLVDTGAATPLQLQGIVRDTRSRVRELAPLAAARPKLSSKAAVASALARHEPDALELERSRTTDATARESIFTSGLPEDATRPTKRTMAALINATLKDEMLARPQMLVFGEDVARKGGVYYVTAGVLEAFGSARVFDTPLDETTILGVAQGTALMGFLPVPEIQYLAYLHNALDQLRGEACSTSFFSNGAFQNPMVVRIPGLAYQKGFGGHFHNDNSLGALRDVPGLLIAVPSRGHDAVRMLRGSLALARAEGRVVAFIEPIALYHERDLYEAGDELWLSDYPTPGDALFPGEVRVYEPHATDVLVVTYGNGVRMALQAAAQLRSHGIQLRVVDVRWISPLPVAAVREHAATCEGVLVVDECRSTGGGVADAILADLAEHGPRVAVATVKAEDSYLPLGPAADLMLVSTQDIIDRVQKLVADRGLVEPSS